MQASVDEPVLYAVEAGIATITLNRPLAKNALSIAAANRLTELWEAADADLKVKAIILTSADCGVFSAGMDLKEGAEARRKFGKDILELYNDPFHDRMRAVTKPIIAAMTGDALAGGMLLCLNSDLRVGLAGTRAAITEAKVGRGSPWAVPLLWMLPEPIVMELVLTGDPLAMERLFDLGFVNAIEPTPDAVRARARALAERICANAPLSVWAGKASMIRAMSLGLEEGLKEAKAIYKRVYASEDAQEGPRAFAEKRKPNWKGC
jgi:enoyl-CoA hydratase/carnithine racemase